MASSSGSLNEELRCSICRDVFTDPVSTPCGHNFCRTCLKEFWKNTPTCFCPLCRETFSRRPDLKINTTLREVVQHMKRRMSQPTPNQTPNHFTVDVRDGSTAYTPFVFGNNIAGSVNMNPPVGTRDNKEQGFDRKHKEERKAKKPKADSTDDVVREKPGGRSQNQRDEDMDLDLK